LAKIYTSQLDYPNALSAYRESLKYYISLADENPAKYSPYVATIFKDLASFYKMQKKMGYAQYFHLKSVEIYNDLSHYNESVYSLKLVLSLIDGVTLYNQHTLSLYQAEAILINNIGERKRGELLEKIYYLRQRKLSQTKRSDLI